MDDRQLREITMWRGKPATKSTTRLDTIVEGLIKKRITRQQKKSGPVVELWQELLPEKLQQHCKLESMKGGILHVEVDTPSYVYQMQLLKQELLLQLQQQCPAARLQQIRFKLSRSTHNFKDEDERT